MEKRDVVIVGSGPAGISTALSLLRRDPGLADRLLVLEKASHPRHKLCGGGVTFTAEPALEHIGIPLRSLDLPQVVIDRIEVRYQEKLTEIRYPGAFRVLRRDEFDAELARRARRRGVEIREKTPVLGLTVDEEGALLKTPSGTIRASAVVGADGANSIIRRKIAPEGPSRLSRLLEILTPEESSSCPEFQGMASFDFSPVKQGVQGYYWDFPCWVRGQARMNRGAFDSRVRTDRSPANLKAALERQLLVRGRKLADYKLQGHPERWYDPRYPCCKPRILLVGDAAGVEPLLGEGIAYALMYGPVAAEAIHQALLSGDFSFSNYDRRLRHSQLGRQLSLRTRFARRVYGLPPQLLRILWPLIKPAAYHLARRCHGRLT